MKLDTFTPSQREAVMTTEEQLLLVAGPGSGKTTTSCARIRKLVEDGVNPREIVSLTFTNSAARESEKRLDGIKLAHCGTLHSFALRMLREHGAAYGYGPRLSVISPESALDLLAEKAKTQGSKVSLKTLLEVKSKGRPKRGARLSVEEIAVASYYDDLKEAGIVDYDLILTEFADALLAPESEMLNAIHQAFTYLFVDEVQDSGSVDWQIYRALPMRWKFLVGDPDQSIYAFRGGRPDLMKLFAMLPGTHVIKLEENFRSRPEICAAANNLIGHEQGRIEKLTLSVREPGGLVDITGVSSGAVSNETEGEEIGRVSRFCKSLLVGEAGPIDPLPTVAVLARSNILASAFERTLAAAGIPVAVRAKSDLPLDWPLARAFVELCASPHNDTLARLFLFTTYRKIGADDKEAREMVHAVAKNSESSGRSINDVHIHLPSGLSAAGVLGLASAKQVSTESRMMMAKVVTAVGHDASALDLALEMGLVRGREEEPRVGGVECMTIHASKGREFDVVFLVGFEDEIMPGRRGLVDEERRLAYVAITRAKERVFITHSETRVTTWGTIEKHKPSRFVQEIGEESWAANRAVAPGGAS